jgi:hypothetical protein
MLTKIVDGKPTATYYAIKINGTIIPNKFLSRMVAEQEIYKLPFNEQQLAEIVIITDDGKEVLFG